MPPASEAVLVANFATRLGVFMVAGFVFIILGLADSHFFRRPLVGQSLAFRLHEGAGFFFGLAHLGALALLPNLNAGAMLAAMVLYAAGLGLFLWAQETIKRQPPFLPFSGVHPETLFTNGPYRLMRHPCYLAFSLVWIAGVIATLNVWLGSTATIMVVSYIIAAREEEEAFMRTRFAIEYRGYQERTGMFVPTLAAVRHETTIAVIAAILVAVALAAVMILDLLTGRG